jgi:outer membrane lipoprotein SlyB
VEKSSQKYLYKKKWTLAGIDWEESHTRSAGKAAAGAIVGKMVAGTVGGIAGAAIGGKKKDTSKAYLHLRVRDQEGVEHTIHIKCDEKLYRQLSALLG